MLDAPVRRVLGPALDRAAAPLDRLGVHPVAVTTTGWVVGVGACFAAGAGEWRLALVLWLLNRLADGLDGPLARRRSPTDLGGFLDVLADFSVYAGFVVGVAVAVPEARLACVVLLTAYYLNGVAFLALSPLLERRGATGDGRSLLFVGGLAEGTETVLAYVVLCLVPDHAETVAWVFAAVVGVTVVQRVGLGVLELGIRDRGRPRTPEPPVPTQEESP